MYIAIDKKRFVNEYWFGTLDKDQRSNMLQCFAKGNSIPSVFDNAADWKDNNKYLANVSLLPKGLSVSPDTLDYNFEESNRVDELCQFIIEATLSYAMNRSRKEREAILDCLFLCGICPSANKKTAISQADNGGNAFASRDLVYITTLELDDIDEFGIHYFLHKLSHLYLFFD